MLKPPPAQLFYISKTHLDTHRMMLDAFRLIHSEFSDQPLFFSFINAEVMYAEAAISERWNQRQDDVNCFLHNPPLVHQQKKCLFYFDR